MTHLKKSLASLALLFGAAALPALAGSLAASSASQSVATSVGSLSNSLQRSSDSSNQTTAAAEGDYKVIDIAAVGERPGMVRMKLQALVDRGADSELFLYVPQAAIDQGRIAQGRIVTARHRAYGIEFASGDTRQPFFLVLDDAWYRELQSNAVVL